MNPAGSNSRRSYTVISESTNWKYATKEIPNSGWPIYHLAYRSLDDHYELATSDTGGIEPYTDLGISAGCDQELSFYILLLFPFMDFLK